MRDGEERKGGEQEVKRDKERRGGWGRGRVNKSRDEEEDDRKWMKGKVEREEREHAEEESLPGERRRAN